MPGEIGRRDGSGGCLAHATGAIGGALAASLEPTTVPWWASFFGRFRASGH
jgi:hypothetical protein